MIRHQCDGCLRRFRLDPDLEPFVCEDCSRLLCPMCAEDGCCRAVPAGPCCSDCSGAGIVDVPGDCAVCDGVGLRVENGITRGECRVCGGGGMLSFSLCDPCGGYGYPQARRVKRKTA